MQKAEGRREFCEIGLAAFVFGGGLCSGSGCQSTVRTHRIKITSRQLPSFWQKAAKDAKVLCQDGGFSILLPDGSALWSFGDTFIGSGRRWFPKGGRRRQ